MPQSLDIFFYLLWHADVVVWSVAFLMSLIAAVILNSYTDDFLYPIVIGTALFISIMVANVAFAYLGIMFTANKNSNIVAAAGAAVCSVTVIGILTLRILSVISARKALIDENA